MGRPVKFSQEQQKKFQNVKGKRSVGTLNRRKRILILCEGEKTEPNYFRALKEDLPKGVLDIDVLGLGANTLTIVRKAKKLYNESQRTTRPFDRVWLVFDRDSFPSDSFDNTIHSADANKFCCAWSNEAFELWYLLHFEYRNTAMIRDDYKRCISRYIHRKYEKNDGTMYNELKDYQQIAIRNAERLLVQHTSVPPSSSNPGTQVHLLIKELMVYIEPV